MKQAWILFLCLAAALPSLTLAQGGTQRQTKLVLPKVEAPDVKPELVILPQVGQGRVDSACFSADGRTAASWSSIGLTVWDIATHRARCFLPDPWRDMGRGYDVSLDEWARTLPSYPMRGIAFLSADGTRVGVLGALAPRGADDRCAVRVWDARDGSLVSTCRAWSGEPPVLSVGSAAFSPDGRQIAATVGYKREQKDPQKTVEAGTIALCVWDALSGAELARGDLPVDDPSLTQTVVAFEADGTLLVCQRESPPTRDDRARGPLRGQAPLRLAARDEWAPGRPLDIVAYWGTRPTISADGRWLACMWDQGDERQLGLWDMARREAVTSFAVATARESPALIACSETRAVVSGPRERGPGSRGGAAGSSSTATYRMWDWRTKQATQLEWLSPGPNFTSAALALSADGAMIAFDTRIYDTETGGPLLALTTDGPARIRLEDRGRRLVWCDERGQATLSWPLDGGAECSANGSRLGDTLLYRDPTMSAWAGPGGLRVISRASGEETLLPQGSAACGEARRLLALDWADGTANDRFPRNDGKAAVARRPDGTVVVAVLGDAPRRDGDTAQPALVVALAYAHADGTVVTAPPMDLWATLGERPQRTMDAGTRSTTPDDFIALSPEGARLVWCFVSCPPAARIVGGRAVSWDLDTRAKLWDAQLPGPCTSPPWYTPSDASLVLNCSNTAGVSLLDSQTGSPRSLVQNVPGQPEAFTSDLAWWVGRAAPPAPAPVGPGPPDPRTDPEGCDRWWQAHLGAPPVLRPPVPALVVCRTAGGAETLLAAGPEGLPHTSGGGYLEPREQVKGRPRAYGSRTSWFARTDLSPDDRRLAVSHDGGVTELWDLPPQGPPERDPVKIATFVHDLFGGAGAAAIPQGYVWSSPGVERLLGWRLGDQVYPYEQFAGRYERPDLVRKVLAGQDISGEKGLTGEMVPPTAAFLAPEYDAKVAGKSVKVEIEVAGVRPLKKVDLLMDGRPVSDDIVATAKEEQIEPNHVVISLDLPMSASARRVRLQAFAYDEEMLRSKGAEVTFTREGAAPPATALYVLSVGVTTYRNTAWNNLKYADADATSFASIAGATASRRLLVNESATSSGVKFALEQMKQNVTEDDVAAIFLAGHGILGSNGDYYFLLYDSDEKDLANTALKWDDFVAALKALRAKLVMVFADTCHSGSLTGSESVNMLIDRLNKKAGVVVFTASRGDEASIEREDWGHGAFTKALIEGFGGKADTYPKDKLVSLAELKDYVIPRVEELTAGRQHPFLPRVEDFDPAQPIASVTAEAN